MVGVVEGIYYMVNGGSNTSFGPFTLGGWSNPVKGVSYRRRHSSFPVLADLNGDGKLDLMLGPADGTSGGLSNTLRFENTATDGVHYYLNTGTTTAPAFTEQTGKSSERNSEPLRTQLRRRGP